MCRSAAGHVHKMSPVLCAGKVQEIVPIATVPENVKEMLKFPVVGNVHEM